MTISRQVGACGSRWPESRPKDLALPLRGAN